MDAEKEIFDLVVASIMKLYMLYLNQQMRQTAYILLRDLDL